MDEVHPLTEYRLKQKPPLSQENLADLLGVSRVTVTRYENGKRKPERPEEIKAISAKTGIPAARLRPDLAELFIASRPPRGPARPRGGTRAKSRAA